MWRLTLRHHVKDISYHGNVMNKMLFIFLTIISICVHSEEVEFYFSWSVTDDDTQELILEKEPSRLFVLRVNNALDSDSRTREKELLKLSLDKEDGYIAEYYLTLDSLSAYPLVDQVDLLERFVAKGILNAKLDIANAYVKEAESNTKYYVKAYELYKEISDSFPVSLYNMAVLAKKSDDIELEPKQIGNLLSEAYQKGYSPALIELSYYHFNGIEVEWNNDYMLALEGMDDNPVALSNVGLAYLKGIGVEKNIEKSVELLKRSVEIKETKAALNNLGVIYLKEYQKIDEAIKYFERALSNGHCKSSLMLGIIYHKDNQEVATKYYKKAIECGELRAKVNLSQLVLESGDIEQGIVMLKEAAETENTTAMYNLGLFLIRGMYIDKDFDKGISYLEKAAEKGHQGSLKILIGLSNTPEIKEYWDKILRESKVENK